MGRERTKEKERDLRVSVALLWGEQEAPTRGPKPSLSPARIAEAAVAIADADGLDAVSMNRLAGEFGVSAMALYRYVPGKAEIVELMVEAVLADRPEVGPAALPGDGGWRAGIERWARASWDVYRAHPWLLAATAMRRQVMGPNQLGWLDAALAALEPAGLSAAQRHRVFVLVVGLVRSVAQEVLDFDADHARRWGELTGELLTRHADRFPALTAAIAEGAWAEAPADPLAFGLERLLDGIQVLVDRT